MFHKYRGQTGWRGHIWTQYLLIKSEEDWFSRSQWGSDGGGRAGGRMRVWGEGKGNVEDVCKDGKVASLKGIESRRLRGSETFSMACVLPSQRKWRRRWMDVRRTRLRTNQLFSRLLQWGQISVCVCVLRGQGWKFEEIERAWGYGMR